MKKIFLIILINCSFIGFSQTEKTSDIPKSASTEKIEKAVSSKELTSDHKNKKIEPPEENADLITESNDNSFNYIKLKWIELLGLLIAILAFFIPIYKYLSQKREEQKDKRFVTYHKLIADLVDPPGGKLDRQIATVFELRNFPNYFELTKRIITDLTDQWSGDEHNARLIAELKLTLIYIKRMSKWDNKLAHKIFGIK